MMLSGVEEGGTRARRVVKMEGDDPRMEAAARLDSAFGHCLPAVRVSFVPTAGGGERPRERVVRVHVGAFGQFVLGQSDGSTGLDSSAGQEEGKRARVVSGAGAEQFEFDPGGFV